MAVYTVLEAGLIESLLRSYTIGRLETFTPVSSGIENTNYFLQTRNSSGELIDWVITIFENLQGSDLPFFNQLTQFLFARDFLVPAPVPLLSGETCFQFHYTDGALPDQQPVLKTGVIVPKLSGQSEHAPDIDMCQQVAAYLAEMHLALADFPAHRAIDHSHDWFEARIKRLIPVLEAHEPQTSDQSDARLLALAWKRYQRYEPELSRCPSGIVHGDLFRDNVLFSNRKISGVIDFYHAGFSPWLFDLAVTANDWARLPEALDHDGLIESFSAVYDQQKLDVLLGAYAQIRPLNTLERNCWPRFLELAALRFWVSRLSTLYLPGYQQQVKQGVSIKPPDEMKRILQAAMGRD